MSFWVRPDSVAADLDCHLLAALLPWLRNVFAIARVVFGSWDADACQLAVLRESGLRQVWTHPQRNGIALHVG